MRRFMTLSAYAKHRGVSAPRITKAIQTGIISPVKDKEGRRMIDVDKADAEWERNIDKSQIRHPDILAKKEYQTKNKITSAGIPSLTESRAIKEGFLARLAKLDFEEKSGKLILVDRVKQQAFECAQNVRNALLNIPQKISAEIASEVDPFKIEQILDKEIRSALEELSRANRG
jgi:hypothetical protein